MRSIETTPDRRYESAADFRNDLRSYVSGNTVKANPVGWLGRSTRWYLRNPRVANLAMGLLLSILIGLAFVSFQWLKARQHLRATNVLTASSLISTNEIGRRFKALAAIQDASEIDITPDLRDLTISALANVDMRLIQTIDIDPRFPFALDGVFHKYATCDFEGQILVRDTRSTEVFNKFASIGRLPQRIELSADGRFLAVLYHKPDGESNAPEKLRVWDLDSGATLNSVPEQVMGNAWDIHPLANVMVISTLDGSAHIIGLEEDEIRNSLSLGTWRQSIAISPDGQKIAVSRDRPHRIEITDIHSGTNLSTISLEHPIQHVNWKSNQELATAAGRQIALWNTKNLRRIWAFEHDASTIGRLEISPDGQFIISSHWNGMISVWRGSDGTLLVNAPGKHWTSFNSDGSAIAGVISDENKLGIWEFCQAPEVRVFRSSELLGPQYVRYSDDDRFLSVSDSSGIQLWRKKDLTKIENKTTTRPMANATFLDAQLVASSGSELYCWPISDQGSTKGAPSLFSIPEFRGMSGNQVAFDCALENVALLNLANGNVIVRNIATNSLRSACVEDRGVGCIALSPNGKFFATATFGIHKTTRLWDLDAQKLVHEFKSGNAKVAFSPDGSLLAVGSETEYDFVELDNLRTKFAVKRSSSLPGPIAFCENTKLVALVENHSYVSLFRWDHGQRVAKLKNIMGGIVSDMDFSPSGDCLAVATENGKVFQWNLKEIREHLKTLDLNWPAIPPVTHQAKSPKGKLPHSFFTESDPVKEQDESWHLEQKRRSQRNGEWQNVISELAILIEKDPSEVSYYLDRASAYANLGRFKMALADFKTALDNGERSAKIWHRCAIIELRLGLLQDYKKTSQTIFNRFIETTNRRELAFATWACLIGQDGVSQSQLQRLRSRFRDLSVKYPRDHIVLNTMALVDFRTGNFLSAKSVTEKSIASANETGNPSDWLLLGLLGGKNGQKEIAEQQINKSLSWIREMSNGLNWFDKLEYQLMIEEIRESLDSEEAGKGPSLDPT